MTGLLGTIPGNGRSVQLHPECLVNYTPVELCRTSGSAATGICGPQSNDVPRRMEHA
jgi:hypothetical protein